MRTGTDGFVRERLVEAREALGISMSALAEAIQVSRQTIHSYENGPHTPSYDVLVKLSTVCGVPPSRFLKPLAPKTKGTVFFRSLSTSTKGARKRADRCLDKLQEIAAHLATRTALPTVDVPLLGLPSDPRMIEMDSIEDIADNVRRSWGLGDGPISNIVWLMENKGIVVSRVSFDARTLDGLSAWIDERPYVLISEDVSAVRARFDACHELGHLIMHRNVTDKMRNEKGMHQLIESQAHRFAAAFAFPRVSFARETIPLSLDHFVRLKSRWRMSVKMMIHRVSDLDLAPEESVGVLYRRYSWRKWTAQEPLDDLLEPELPRLLGKAIDLSLSRITAGDLEAQVGLYGAEISRLCCLQRRELDPQPAEVIPFRRPNR